MPLALEWLVLCCFACVPLMRYGGHIITDTDAELALAPGHLLDHLSAPWNDREELGFDYTRSQSMTFPPGIVFWLLHSMDVPADYVHQTWIVIVLLTAGVGMRYFVRLWLRTRLSALLVAIGYMWSSYVVVLLPDTTMFFLGYALLPVQLGLAMQLTTQARLDPRKLALLAISFVFVSAIDIPILIINAVTVFGFSVLIALLCRKRGEVISTIGAIAGALVLGLALLSWTVIPIISSYRTDSAAVSENLQAEGAWLYNQHTSFAEVLRLQGYWALYSGYAERPYRAYQEYYLESPIGIVGGYALVALAAVGFAVRRRDPVAIALGVTFVASIPLVVGEYPPGAQTAYSEAVGWAFHHVPGATIFRDTFKVASVSTFAAVALAGGALERISTQRVSRAWRPLLSLALLGTSVAIAQPLWGGRLWWPTSLIERVPEDWLQMADWLNKRPGDERVLYLPKMERPVYFWGSPATEIGEAFIDRPQVSNLPGVQSVPGDKFVSALYREIEQPRARQTAHTLSLLVRARIKYLVVRADVRFGYYPTTTPPHEVEATLRAMPGVSFQRRFGRLAVYSLESDLPPLVNGYSSRSSTEPGARYLLDRQRSPGVGREGTTRLLGAVAPGADISTSEVSSLRDGAVSVRRVRSTRYEVAIQDSNEDTVLVLRESYHPGWTIRITEGVGRVQDHAVKHVIVDDYANGWILPAHTRRATIVYEPSMSVGPARGVSAFFVAIAVAMAVGPGIVRTRIGNKIRSIRKRANSSRG